MILLAHMLFGAAIGTIIKNPLLGVILAFLSHYFLDFFPHVEYSIENIKNKSLKKSLPDFLKISLDFLAGIAVISFLSNNSLIIFICAFFAILPDGFTILSYLFPNKILKIHDVAHRQKIHFLMYKKISNFWRILTQAAAIVFSILLII